ncbi:hypothetical protein PG997_003264 [Apiospora hydei]|uniref:Uncharacterized protein n=1 Tax=Apiospora hydei TaxID=1337664 RepID=A0ABR1WYQ9_9PEZI
MSTDRSSIVPLISPMCCTTVEGPGSAHEAALGPRHAGRQTGRLGAPRAPSALDSRRLNV